MFENHSGAHGPLNVCNATSPGMRSCPITSRSSTFGAVTFSFSMSVITVSGDIVFMMNCVPSWVPST